MVQVAHKTFQGFGVIYPDGARGIKVVKTFTKGSTKTVNPDGSVSYSTPPPTVHELYGGGFSYAAGTPVTNRVHLEGIDDPKMRERALKWYDTHGSAMAPPEVVVKEGEPERPEPAYILSNQVSPDGTITQEIKEGVITPELSPIEALLTSLASSVASLGETIKKQGEELAIVKVMAEKKEKKFGDRRLKQFKNMKIKGVDDKPVAPEFPKE